MSVFSTWFETSSCQTRNIPKSGRLLYIKWPLTLLISFRSKKWPGYMTDVRRLYGCCNHLSIYVNKPKSRIGLVCSVMFSMGLELFDIMALIFIKFWPEDSYLKFICWANVGEIHCYTIHFGETLMYLPDSHWMCSCTTDMMSFWEGNFSTKPARTPISITLRLNLALLSFHRSSAQINSENWFLLARCNYILLKSKSNENVIDCSLSTGNCPSPRHTYV